MKEDKSLLFSHSAPDSVSLGATALPPTLSHTYRNTCMQSLGSSRVIKKKNSVYPGNINKRLREPTRTLAEGGIVLCSTPSDRRPRGIHLYSLFMSYGAFAKLTLRLTLNAHSVCLSGFQTELLCVCVFSLMCNSLLYLF